MSSRPDHLGAPRRLRDPRMALGGRRPAAEEASESSSTPCATRCKADFEGTLPEVAAIGFKEVEFAGYPRARLRQLESMPRPAGPQRPRQHVSLRGRSERWERTLEEARTDGAPVPRGGVIDPGGPPRSRMAGSGSADCSTRPGARRSRGIQFGYHNHDYEFGAAGGAASRTTCCSTPTRTVRWSKMELDLYWITKGGQDPLDYFAKYPGRFPLVHVKDMDGHRPKWCRRRHRDDRLQRESSRRPKQAGIQHYFVRTGRPPGARSRRSHGQLRST